MNDPDLFIYNQNESKPIFILTEFDIALGIGLCFFSKVADSLRAFKFYLV